MKKYLLASTILVASAFGAIAADLPARVPAAAPAPVFVANSWTGFYVGAHAGYSWGKANAGYDAAQLSPLNINLNTQGFLGGIQAGYNHQLQNNVVIGIEGSVSLTNISGRMGDELAALVQRPGNTIHSNTSLGGTVGPRLGYSFGAFLPFITGGVAFANNRFRATDGNISIDKTFTGWFIGGGFEYKIAQNLSLKVDYAHYSFGTERYFAGQPFSSTSKPSSDTVRVGINYFFGSAAAPVVAKY